MARSLIAAMSASFLLTLGATLGSAEAQTAGAPLPLLQIDHARTAAHAHRRAPARIAKTEPARKTAHRHIAKHSRKSIHAKTRVADAGRDLPAPPTTTRQAPPQSDSRNVWPSPTTTALGYAATPGIIPADGGHAAALPPAPSAAVKTELVVGTDPNGILNGGHAVPAAMPNPPSPVASTPAPKPATTAMPVKTAIAAPAVQKPAPRAMLVRQNSPNAVGSASWIAQMLAALGGAIAAGAVAWFLIRPAPQRNYG